MGEKHLIMSKDRYLRKQIGRDLEKKMVFIGGPRQVGKTFLAQNIIQNPSSYLNWDILEHKNNILQHHLPNTDCYIFDEIHKYSQWRNFIKGVYDQFGKTKKIIVTGSAKLDYYRYGGDSLQGRYNYFRLHPFSVAELQIETQRDLMDLFELGGFPEPFLSGSQSDAKRWSLQYRDRLINEEIRDLERIQDISKLELLMMSLPEMVGSPLSINALRNRLSLAFKTVDRWICILERMYYIFRLPPFHESRIKSVKKEQKHFHYDWSVVSDRGARFENFIACHLLKWCHYQRDCFGEEYELAYFRDSQGREVDFVLLQNRAPIAFIETKYQKTEISKHLQYLRSKFPKVDCFQVVYDSEQEYLTIAGIALMPAVKFLQRFV